MKFILKFLPKKPLILGMENNLKGGKPTISAFQNSISILDPGDEIGIFDSNIRIKPDIAGKRAIVRPTLKSRSRISLFSYL